MGQPTTIIREQIGLRYESVLLPVDSFGAAALRDELTGAVFPTQWVPALPFDATQGDKEQFILADVQPHQELRLARTEQDVEQEGGVRVLVEDGHAVIVNGPRAVRLPQDGWVEQPFPGPVDAFRLGDGDWFGSMALVDAPFHGRVSTVVEALGPCCAQWRTVCRWGQEGGACWVMRWAAGSDTLLVAEDVFESSDAAVEWHPFGEANAAAFVRGGGEGTGPMERLTSPSLSAARRGAGRRVLGWLSHVSYFNQWDFSWVGFDGGDERFVGLFTGWGGLWQRRGDVRIEIWQDDQRGDFLRFPLKQGRRLYGVVLTDRERSGIDRSDVRCLLNRRKTQLSDVRPDKAMSWRLEAPPQQTRTHLVRTEDLEGFRDRIASDADLASALDAHAQSLPGGHPTQVATALWTGDAERLRGCAGELLEFAEGVFRDAADGGYEHIIIFHGRRAKRVAYDLDVLWALGLIGEDDFRRVSAALLLLAHIFADPDYCLYEDFWPATDPDSGMAAAMKDDMGDCPVPPNFAAEFFSTTAVVAELLEQHPLSGAWRAWSMQQLDRYLEAFFEEDGTYHESVNYHSHAFNELLCQIYPLRIKGVRDYFAEQRIKGSFRHFVEMQMPALSRGLADVQDGRRGLYAGAREAGRCPLPADGNSGGEGLEMDYRGELMVGASVYRDSDPDLAGQLACTWRRAGRPLVDMEHPVLTLLTLDPTIPSVEPAFESCRRHSLGVISKARRADGLPVWCIFRAGRATHHMDFDQGNLHLALGDAVLLGEYGYHAHDEEGGALTACATWLHNTVVYSDDRRMSSGYTGLEKAPEPVLVHLGAEFDWVVHRIVNTNFRCLDELDYRVQLPVPTTRHVRHYLFVKPDYFLIWDVFEEAHGPSTLWLHPREPVVAEAEGIFRAGEAGRPHLRIQFILPERPDVVESRQLGPLWSFGVRNAEARPYMVLLVPEARDRGIVAALGTDGRSVSVEGEGLSDTIRLPEPGSDAALPEVLRGIRRT